MLWLRRSLATFAWILVTTAPSAAATTIDFETPPLGAAGSAIINPYISAGVTFTAVPQGFGDEIVGIVKNSATSACADPADANQKLGTGRSSFAGGAIGLGVMAIRADLPPGTNLVSVELQCVAGNTGRVRLFNAADVQVGIATDVIGPPIGTCGNPGGPRGRTTLLAISAQPAAYAIMDVVETGYVLVLDNFTYDAVPTSAVRPSWGAIKTLYR
jgi:hypothetical protein